MTFGALYHHMSILGTHSSNSLWSLSPTAQLLPRLGESPAASDAATPALQPQNGCVHVLVVLSVDVRTLGAMVLWWPYLGPLYVLLIIARCRCPHERQHSYMPAAMSSTEAGKTTQIILKTLRTKNHILCNPDVPWMPAAGSRVFRPSCSSSSLSRTRGTGLLMAGGSFSSRPAMSSP